MSLPISAIWLKANSRFIFFFPQKNSTSKFLKILLLWTVASLQRAGVSTCPYYCWEWCFLFPKHHLKLTLDFCEAASKIQVVSQQDDVGKIKNSTRIHKNITWKLPFNCIC